MTVYGKDEFGLVFELGTGPERKRRFTRYSSRGSQSTDAALAELTERQLLELFRHRSLPGRRRRAVMARYDLRASALGRECESRPRLS